MAKPKKEPVSDWPEWKPGMVFIEHKSGSTSHIEQHQCWNTDLFIDNLFTRLATENAKEKDVRKHHTFRVSDRDAYYEQLRRNKHG